MENPANSPTGMNEERTIRPIIDERRNSKLGAENKKPVTRDDQLEGDYSKNLSTAYQQLCISYHAIDDFRAKLLGLLPLTTGTGILFLVTDKGKIDFAQPFLGPIALFGFMITLSLFFYELHGIKKCAYLIDAGRQMECDMKIHGQFLSRPHEVAGFIDEPFTASLIYPAVLAAWTYLGLFFTFVPVPQIGSPSPLGKTLAVLVIAGVVFFVGWVTALRLLNAIDDDLANRDEKNRKAYIKEPSIRIFRGGPDTRDPCEKKRAP